MSENLITTEIAEVQPVAGSAADGFRTVFLREAFAGSPDGRDESNIRTLRDNIGLVKEFQTARQVIYYDTNDPSPIVLPVIPAGK